YNYNYLLDVLDGDYCAMDIEGLNLIKTRYEAMTSSEIAHFNIEVITGQDSNEYTGLEAYNQAMNRRAELSDTFTIVGLTYNLFENNNLLFLMLIVFGSSILSITFIHLRKKKRY
ncbi:MAG: hypothetical protein WDA35_01080, partial [Bacilli bacterium]